MKKFNFKSVKIKLFAIFIIMMIIPVVILGTLSYLKSYDTLKSEKTTFTVDINKQINSSLNEFTSGLGNITTMLSNSQAFQTIVTSEESGEATDDILSKPDIVSIRNVLTNLLSSNSNIKAAYIGTRNKNMYSGKAKVIYAEKKAYDPTTSEWYKASTASTDQVVWTKPYLDNNKDNKEPITVVTVAHAIEQNGTVYGAMAMDINLNKLIKKINGIKVGKAGFVYITNSSGEILVYPDKKKVGTLTSSKALISILNKDSGNLNTTIDGKEYITSFTTEPNTKWKIICNYPVSELNENAAPIKNFMLIVVVITIILALIIASFVSNKMVIKPLSKLNEVFKKSSTGDLTAKVYINTGDEFADIADGYNNMTSNLKILVSKIKDYSKIMIEQSSSLKTTAGQTQIATNDTAQNISEISKANISQVSAAEKGIDHISELSNHIEHISASIGKIENTLINAQSLNEKGMSIVSILTDKTQKTISAEEKLTNVVSEVNDSSIQIKSISETINEISEQTNLLALNASIEAARAGDAGKGFAVVADEVRKLAEQTSEASNKIYELVKEIQERSKYAVDSINSNKQIFYEQNSAVNDTKNMFSDIYSEIKNLYYEVKQVNALNSEMINKKNFMVQFIQNIAASSEQTCASTQQVSASTEETLAMIEEFNSHTDELYKLAENFKESISIFKTQD